MKKKINYKKGNIGKVEIVNDFLPEPKGLILKNESIENYSVPQGGEFYDLKQ